MKNGIQRRGFLKQSATFAALAAGASVRPDLARAQVKRHAGTRITIGLNRHFSQTIGKKPSFMA